MTDQSDGSPNATDDKRQNSGYEITQTTNGDQQNVTEPVEQSSATSVFVNSQPMREEQVQNAVKFLSHPKVKGSPVMYRRSFLEKKGLTKEEIDEAFRRVPDSPPSVQTSGVNQDGQLRPSPNVQQQAQPQTLQPAGASVSTGTTPLSGTLSRYRFHWSHAVIAVGLLTASGAGTAVLIKNSILPRLKSWIRKVVVEDEVEQRTDSKPTLAEDTAQAAKEAAAAAAEMVKVSQKILTSKSEERRYFEAYVSHLDEQVQQMKSLTNVIKRLEALSGGTSLSQQEYRATQGVSKQVFVNDKGEYAMRSVRSSSPPASLEPAAPPPMSHTDMMATVQRGERPSHIRPWELGQVQSNYTEEHRTLVNDDELISMGNSIRSNGKDPVKSNGDVPSPWWQRKNVRIQEIENEYEQNAESSQQPVRRSWVPPQPPPIAMPEAAEAIRRPKPSVPKEQASDDQSVAHSSDTSDELQRIPQISEPEGATEDGSVKYDGETKHEEPTST